MPFPGWAGIKCSISCDVDTSISCCVRMLNLIAYKTKTTTGWVKKTGEFSYPTKMAITPSISKQSGLDLSESVENLNKFCARYRFNLITLGVEKIQQFTCYR